MERILLVDDEPHQLKSLTIGLMHRGYAVDVASDGRTALEKFSTAQPPINMVVTDYSMPGMDGLELLSKIREKSRSMPVILITAYGRKDLVIDALRNQCDGFIEKPFSLDALTREIERIKCLKLSNTGSHDLIKLLPRLIHHVNNPLMAISGHAQLGMSNLHDQHRLRKHFESIGKSVDSIQDINREIAQLGVFSPEGVQGTGDFNLVEAIEESIELFQGLADLKGVEIVRQFHGSEVILHGSRRVLKQAFKNLILNALDAMDNRPVKRLEVEAGPVREGSKILIRFEDTGCGISEEHRRKIFDPYFTSKAKGTGLGLAIVKEIVAVHHGDIVVKSQVNSGTCFTMELPLGGRNAGNKT